jgi:hypothetical protein
VLAVDYWERATLHLGVPSPAAADLPTLLAQLTGGEAAPEPAGTAWVDAGTSGGGD